MINRFPRTFFTAYRFRFPNRHSRLSKQLTKLFISAIFSTGICLLLLLFPELVFYLHRKMLRTSYFRLNIYFDLGSYLGGKLELVILSSKIGYVTFIHRYETCHWPHCRLYEWFIVDFDEKHFSQPIINFQKWTPRNILLFSFFFFVWLMLKTTKYSVWFELQTNPAKHKTDWLNLFTTAHLIMCRFV